jgi:hypothetical protein
VENFLTTECLEAPELHEVSERAKQWLVT